jgi:DNA-binding MarR family transcriptional regulator
VADGLHSAAIHLLRRLRRTDDVTGLTPARLSVLSIVVFAGPRTLGELASAEQVRPPTMTRLVHGLVREGLARRVSDPEDGRVTRVRATIKGRRLLERARTLRLEELAQRIGKLRAAERAALAAAIPLIEQLAE